MKLVRLLFLAALSATTSFAQAPSTCSAATGIWNFDDDFYFVIQTQADDGSLTAWASDPTQPQCGQSCGVAATGGRYDPASGAGYLLYPGYRVDFVISAPSCTTIQSTETHPCESGTCKGTWSYTKTTTLPTGS
jgi:hypothetical protein